MTGQELLDSLGKLFGQKLQAKSEFRSETTYRKFPLGSVIVHPNRPIPPPGEAEPSVLIPTSNPRLTISPTGATPHR